MIFHAATRRERDRFVSWGGRVLNVVARDADIDGAVKRAYEAAAAISFDGMIYRKDIAWRAMKKPVNR